MGGTRLGIDAETIYAYVESATPKSVMCSNKQISKCICNYCGKTFQAKSHLHDSVRDDLVFSILSHLRTNTRCIQEQCKCDVSRWTFAECRTLEDLSLHVRTDQTQVHEEMLATNYFLQVALKHRNRAEVTALQAWIDDALIKARSDNNRGHVTIRSAYM